MIPGTAMYVYLGSLITSVSQLASGAPSGGMAKQALTFLGFAATVAVTIVITRIARRALDEATVERADERDDVRRPCAAVAPGPLVLPDDEDNRRLLGAGASSRPAESAARRPLQPGRRRRRNGRAWCRPPAPPGWAPGSRSSSGISSAATV